MEWLWWLGNKSICKSGGVQFSTLNKVAKGPNWVVSQYMIKINFDERSLTFDRNWGVWGIEWHCCNGRNFFHFHLFIYMSKISTVTVIKTKAPPSQKWKKVDAGPCFLLTISNISCIPWATKWGKKKPNLSILLRNSFLVIVVFI